MFEGIEEFCKAHEHSIAALEAISTFGAVIVALYLARRQTTSKLHIVAGIRKLAGYGSSVEDHLLIRVTNIGVATTSITGLGWEVGFRPTRRFLQQVPDPVDSLPHELATGQQLSFYFPLH